MPGRLDGKIALITGGARGQGAAEARLFAVEGATVALTDVLDREGRATADAIEAATYHHLNVTDEAAWNALVDEVLAAHGRLDVLVNNAGIFLSRSIVEMPLEDYRRVIEVNQVGVFLGMKVAGRAMIHAGNGGTIINISSIAGLRGTAGSGAYAASKFAVRGMTKVAAREFARDGIRVNSIHPGLVETAMLQTVPFWERDPDAAIKMVPMRRLAVAEEVARMALFLASDEASYSTGSEFVVDGGILA